MPFHIVEYDDGYRVCNKNNNKCYSKYSMSYNNALKQLRALYKNYNKNVNDDKFIKQLNKIEFDPNLYLYIARQIAEKKGYDPLLLNFSHNNNNKLSYDSPEGLKHFGKAGYNDFIIYNFLELNNMIEKGYSQKKRNVFIKSHSKITEKYNLNKYSPNELSINILW